MLDKFRENSFLNYGLYGLRPASAGLIAAACWGVAEIALLNLEVFEESGLSPGIFKLPEIILAVLIFAAMRKFKGHPIFYLAFAAMAGIVFKM